MSSVFHASPLRLAATLGMASLLPLALLDFASWEACMLGPDNGPLGEGCETFDGNADRDVDLRDFADFQNNMIGP